MIIEALTWQPATITAIRDESPTVKTFTLDTITDYPFIAGQHMITRVTLENGFKSARDYSMSSAPSSGSVEITIARAPEGEVSGWFHASCKIGDTVEITPPLGTDFTWSPDQSLKVSLIAGGVGVTPFMSMLRERSLTQTTSPMKLFYSAKNYADICFKDELLNSDDATIALTRMAPSNWNGLTGRITTEQLTPFIENVDLVYICGSYGFVAEIKALLGTSGFPSTSIRTEPFN